MSVKVSVLMSCKNSKQDLLENCVNAVLCQTFQDFELVVIDDGSDEPIEPTIRSISMDRRIKVFRLAPSGLGAALSYGIQQTKGEYIARIDDDDLMAIHRLEKQVLFLDSHPDVACVGSNRYSYCNGRYLKHKKFPTEHEDIVSSMLSLKFVMAHSALMYRRDSALKIGCYRIKGTGEDLDFILQLSLVGKLANLDEYLLYYNLSMGSLSAKNSQLPGHIFALKEYKKSNNYNLYANIVDHSIANIETQIRENKKQMLWKKWIIIRVISLFGKKLPRVL